MAQPVDETGRLVEVVRTCIGCRQRSDKTDLVRVVAAQGSPASVVAPDPRGTLPGRGAHLHPTQRCLDLAIRRRAFGRALRIEGPTDLDALAAFISARPTTAP